MGADIVIAVDVFLSQYRRKGGSLGVGLSMIETLVCYADSIIGKADFLIAPWTAWQTYTRFSRSNELSTLNEVEVKEELARQLEAIGELLSTSWGKLAISV